MISSTIVITLIIMLAVIIIFIFLKTRTIPVESKLADSNVQQIFIPTNRVVLICFPLLIFGVGILFILILGMNNYGWTYILNYLLFIPVSAFSLAIIYVGIKYYLLRNNLLQIEIGDTKIRFKSLEGGITHRGYSIIFLIIMSKKWVTLNYDEIKKIEICRSNFAGNCIHLLTDFNGSIEIPLLLSNDRELEELCQKINV